MKINVYNEKKSCEVGDIIKLKNDSIRMIVRKDQQYAMINMSGVITSEYYNSIEELLGGIHVVKVYKNEDIQLTLKEDIL